MEPTLKHRQVLVVFSGLMLVTFRFTLNARFSF